VIGVFFQNEKRLIILKIYGERTTEKVIKKKSQLNRALLPIKEKLCPLTWV
jgi:hypothetical protein